MNSHNYFKDMDDYNVMVSFLCKAGIVREGYAVLQEMKKKGFCPNVSSYNYIMEACFKEDLLRPARKVVAMNWLRSRLILMMHWLTVTWRV